MLERSPEPSPSTREELAVQLRSLGVRPGDLLLVHASFRAVAPVAGGPLGLVHALLDAVGPAGTLVMPSAGDDDDAPFDPLSTPSSPSLGVVADTFWRLSGAWRSDHPQAFAAMGPLAPTITADPLPLPPHAAASPVGRVHELDGKVLLLGVGHDADTMLHLAELLADVPYRVPRHLTVLPYHCCERFALADGWLRCRGLQADGRVGQAHARLARAQDIVEIAREHLEADPLLFLHDPSARCAECDEARGSATAH